MKNPVDTESCRCDFVRVRIFQQSVVAVFLLAFFAVSGTDGLCGFFTVAGVNHHHHQHEKADHDTCVCFGGNDHCEQSQSQVPCGEASDDAPEFQFTARGNVEFVISCPVTGYSPLPVAAFGELEDFSTPEFITRCDPIRGSPVNRHLVLCRFLV